MRALLTRLLLLLLSETDNVRNLLRGFFLLSNLQLPFQVIIHRAVYVISWSLAHIWKCYSEDAVLAYHLSHQSVESTIHSNTFEEGRVSNFGWHVRIVTRTRASVDTMAMSLYRNGMFEFTSDLNPVLR